MLHCPYCKHELNDNPPPRCPHCGKVMVTPKMLETPVRIAKKRAIDQIWRENEQKKASLHGVFSPGAFRSPKIYFLIIFVLVVLGLALLKATDSAISRNKRTGRRETPEARTYRHLNTLATALGRYRFHVGAFPTVRQGGLGALVRDPGAGQVPNWLGPYINVLPPDPWLSPFEYKPPQGTNALPVLFSRGPDKIAHTADDIYPDPKAFDPGTAWTNGWLPAAERYVPGVNVIPSKPVATAPGGI